MTHNFYLIFIVGIMNSLHYIPFERVDPCFSAQINDRNHSLFPSPEETRTPCEKIGYIALNIFSLGIAYGLKQLAIKYYCKDVSPEIKNKFNTFWNSEKSAILRETFNPEHHRILTPDQATLEAILYRHKNSDENTPTLLYCNGLGQVQEGMEINEYLKQNINRQPCNFVTFNYRSVTSQNHLKSSKDFIVDCESVLQFIEKELGTPPHKVHFHGRSLGGGVAIKTQALDSHLTGINVNESSFTSIQNVIALLICRPLASLNDALDFGMEVEADFWRLNARRKIVMIHPNDNVIKFPVSLANAVKASQDERTHIIYLKIKDGFKPQDPIHDLSIEAFQDSDSDRLPLEAIAMAIHGSGPYLSNNTHLNKPLKPSPRHVYGNKFLPIAIAQSEAANIGD